MRLPKLSCSRASFEESWAFCAARTDKAWILVGATVGGALAVEGTILGSVTRADEGNKG